MMKPNELRIGNYVSIDNEVHWPELKSIPFMVSGILNHSISLENIFKANNPFDRNYSQKPCFIEPIHLTEEWLLKFGFSMQSKEMYFISGMQIWKCNDIFICNKNGIVIKTAHQLQNLYFALTGEELTIKD